VHGVFDLRFHPAAPVAKGAGGNFRRGRRREQRACLKRMFDLPPTLTAILAGFLSGFVVSVPVGPVNLTILNEGARRGFKWAALIGLGATFMEVLYCILAFTG